MVKHKDLNSKREVVRISGHLNEVVTAHDDDGNVLHKIISPLMVEFHQRDVLQVIVGATLLAVPMAFTEEAWGLGLSLPGINVIGIMILSIIFISSFVYYNYYRGDLRHHWSHFLKRVLLTYVISFLVVAVVLTLINLAPWYSDIVLTAKRIIIIAFPASMSAAVADFLK